MTQVEEFLKRVSALPVGPGVSLDSALAPSIQDEATLRRLFATDRQNSRLADPYVGLVDVFSAPSTIRATRARVIKDDDDKKSHYILPLADGLRRREAEPCMEQSIEAFQRNWAVFTEGSLSQLTDWNNVVAAGGSVLGCLLPIPDSAKESKRAMRKYFHFVAYPTSDVDLFLWGLTPRQAEVKIKAIYNAVRDSVPWDVTCIRTKHAISIHSQYPYRSVQIVLRLYQSPAEILAGFDVDCPCVLYNGDRVMANPRAIVAMMRQCNTVDITRRSPSYELRLAKYASRGFEVYVNDLRRSDIDPTIFERSINRVEGLARLLVLERLSDPEVRTKYLDSRRALRSRPANQSQTNNVMRMKRQRKYKGDLKAVAEIGGLEMNDYDVSSLHIPYGPGWKARRIDKLVYQTDLGMNSTFNPKNKGRILHRHPAFFGTMKECLEDCCEHCPEPRTDEERELEKENQKHYISGRVTFMQEDPGRQIITGSFDPIDIGEWSSQAYVSASEKLFTAIAALDRITVQQMIHNGVDVNRRDYVGRTPLHLAILVKASDISCDLIDAGSRMSARLVDGRTCLHLAAQLDLPLVVQRLLERSAVNLEKAEEEKKKSDAPMHGYTQKDDSGVERLSSEDDWSSDEADAERQGPNRTDEADSQIQKQSPPEAGDIPEDPVNLPDILDINVTSWDFAISPLGYAIISGSLRSIDLLLNAGADPKLATKVDEGNAKTYHPLTLTILTVDDDTACAIMEKLLRAGVTTSQADENLFTAFHAFVCSGRRALVMKALQADPNAKVALNVPYMQGGQTAVFPLVSAIAQGDYALTCLLLAYGANVTTSAEDLDRAKHMMVNKAVYRFQQIPVDYLQNVYLPAEVSIAYQNHLIYLLVDCGAQISVPCLQASIYGKRRVQSRFSLIDWVDDASAQLMKEPTNVKSSGVFVVPQNPKAWKEQRVHLQGKLQMIRSKKATSIPAMSSQYEKLAKSRAAFYFADVARLLEKHGAKSWNELYPDLPRGTEGSNNAGLNPMIAFPVGLQGPQSSRPQYQMLEGGYVALHLLDQYDELYEACWTGDVDRIQELCLPSEGREASKPPIQISVQQVPYGPTDGLSFVLHKDGAYTPLAVAILARRWDVAQLVLAITTAQWKRPESDPIRFTTTNITLNDSGSELDDDDDDDDESDDSRKPLEFVDVAKRPSAVQCNVSPSQLLTEANAARVSTDGTKEITGSVLDQAVQDNDLEAFVHICSFKKLLGSSLEPEELIMDSILHTDSANILEEYIRLTGAGVVAGQLVSGESEASVGTHDDSKVYLGLSVHGKKRKDLATKFGNQTPQTKERVDPLLWRAAQAGAIKIVRFLSGTAALTAYQYYATTGASPRAMALRRLENLAESLPRLLGVFPNSRNETVVTAAILGSSKESVLTITKLLLALYPMQSKFYLHSSIRNIGFTPMLLAVAQNSCTQLIDFLLANGVSPDATDSRGWNVFHFVCAAGFKELLIYLLEKLPMELSSRLLLQTSYEYVNTPLMLAVKTGKLRIIELLLQAKFESVKKSLIMRDVSGSIPLHIAIRAGYADISSLLISGGPLEALYMENGVGETPMEMASAQCLLGYVHYRPLLKLPTITTLQILPQRQVHTTSLLHDLDKLTVETKNVKEVMAVLEEEGWLIANSKLRKSLESFMDFLDKRSREVKSAAVASTQETERLDDREDRLKTLHVVSAGIIASPGLRRLVHLSDVQKSVSSSLEKSLSPSLEPYGVIRLARKAKIRDANLEADVADKDDNTSQWQGILRFRNRDLERNSSFSAHYGLLGVPGAQDQFDIN